MQGMIEGIPSSWVPSYARGLSILLVDHDQTSLTYLGSMLEQYSYKVTTAVLATDALAMLRQEKDRFKLIMASVDIPDMDTISFLRQLLRNGLPVILIAPERSVPAAMKALAEGASFYLDKPISMDDLKYIWQHVYTNKRKRAIHENPNNEGNPKIAKTSNRSIIKDVLNNASRVTATRDHIKHYISLSKDKDRQPSNYPSRDETMIDCNDPKGKGKQIVEDESNKRDSRSFSDERLMNMDHGNDKSNGCSSKKNSGDNAEEKISGNGWLRKQPRVVWSPELHLKFIAAVSRLGDKKAVPKYILEMMNVPGLTHRQVASHLQKFKAQVERISKASERMDAETLRYHCSRFLTVSEILERSNALLRALERRNSSLITITEGSNALAESQNKDQQTDLLPSTKTTNGIDATKSPVLNDVDQSPVAIVEPNPTSGRMTGSDNFVRDFRELDLELDMEALEAFYNSTSGDVTNADKSLENSGEVNATTMAALNLFSGTEPTADKFLADSEVVDSMEAMNLTAENEPVADDYLVDFCDKNPETDVMQVTENLVSPSTEKQPLSNFKELLNALEEEAHGLEGQVAGPTQGDVDRYYQLLENVLIEGSSQ